MNIPYLKYGLLLAAFVLAIPTSAEVAQRPLLGGGSAPPNLVFTLDDSGSMFFECLPDGLCVLTDSNGNVSLGVGTVPVDFPGSALKNAVATYDSYVNCGRTCSASDPVVTSPNLFGRRMRSSSTNPIYYDPAVLYLPWLKPDGTRYPNSVGTAAEISPENATSTTIDLTTPYAVNTTWCSALDEDRCTTELRKVVIAQYFRLTSGTGTAVGNFTQTIISSATTSYPKASTRTDCTGTTCTYANELQNFANWFTYARNRARVAIGGTAEAFANVPATYRVGYGRINKTSSSSIDGVNTATLERGVRSFTGTDRADFYTWLFGRALPSGGTPLRRAMDDVGQYYSRSDNAGPWGAVPGTNNTTAHAICRRSFHVLMTDGGWNGNNAPTSGATGNADGTAGAAITGPNGQNYTYAPTKPYTDNNSGTLADVAMYYWKRDLRPDLDNGVTPSGSNPAFWQHMVNHTISFGIDGSLDNPGDLAALISGSKSWPNPTTDPTKVDDLWHAAVNSRGTSGSARNSTEYAAALQSAFASIEAATGSEAGVAVSTRSLTDSTRKYVPTYNSAKWSGDITAVTVPVNGTDGVQVWSAKNALPAPAVRNIYTYDKAAVGTKAVSFTWDSLPNPMKTTLFGATTGGEGLVSYLRGDRSGESSIYRLRESALGDIVNSSPALVGTLVDQQYDFLPSGLARDGYKRFLRAKSFRQAQVYVGANDGMLHAFSDADGKETFAFMPAAVLGNVKDLASTSYSHRYFVDGPVTEADVYDVGASKWRNLVVAGGGAGAKNLFAINVPVPAWPTTGTPTMLTTAQSTPAATDILWEIDSTTTGFGELGNVLSSPEFGLTRDGTWVMIVGNGYDSASAKAQLFVINALTGALIKKLDTGVGSASDPNGLGGVRVVRDTNQRIVSAYAGDLKGNLWKFDFSGDTLSSWVVAFGGAPLFVAINASSQREPITAAPTYALHPKGGVQVLVGTGKLFETGDPAVMDQRALYGVWDTVAVGTISTDPTKALTNNSALVAQSITGTAIAGTSGGTFYAVSSNPVDYGTNVGNQKRGWRLPLTIAAGQRLIYDPLISTGRVFFETMVPSGGVASCSVSSISRYGFLLDPFFGGPGRDGTTFDTNGDGVFDSRDNASAAVVELGSSGGSTIVSKGGNKIVIIGAGGSGGGSGGGGGGGGSSGSGGSREAAGATPDSRRNWRQIINPPT